MGEVDEEYYPGEEETTGNLVNGNGHHSHLNGYQNDGGDQWLQADQGQQNGHYSDSVMNGMQVSIPPFWVYQLSSSIENV